MLSAVSAIAAQNIGAGKDERATKTLKYAIMISMSFGLCVAVLMHGCPNFSDVCLLHVFYLLNPASRDRLSS
jgi:Na+-driven multidrug efflux pump